ncbi:MAG: winged helix family transcriptional regulator [Acidimicrobiia bacterium]|nr:winged helix family transcriptional regulator [Acidimicrobiia bacterium]
MTKDDEKLLAVFPDPAPIDVARTLDLSGYSLLKFLAQNPGKVFSREVLLSRVWGYEYYGGARTVDVHIRRLRAKLGEEHANLIETVRSVGYRFGQSKWG